MSEIIKSLEYDQNTILKNIVKLYTTGGFCVDFTYGSGNFYKDIPPPRISLALECIRKDDIKNKIKCNDTNTPIKNGSVRSVMCDPPFLTYIKNGRSNNSIMGKQFSGYWRYEELINHYEGMIKEAHRVLYKKGVLIFKCQDIIHNHRIHATHYNTIKIADTVGFNLEDLFILGSKNRIPVIPNKLKKGNQKHARVFHSYFLIFKKKAK